MTSELRDGAPAAPEPAARSPWIAVGVILVGSYAAVLDVTVVGVASRRSPTSSPAAAPSPSTG